MLKIRRPLGRLIFIMGFAIPGKTVFLIETAPRSGRVIQSWVHVPPERSVVTIRPLYHSQNALKVWGPLTDINCSLYVITHPFPHFNHGVAKSQVSAWMGNYPALHGCNFLFMPCKARVYIYIYHRYWKNASENRYSVRLNNYSYFACVEQMHLTL